ncbi:Beta-lactamase hydrolase-like protein, partial [mine drainage metagenome]
MNAALARIYNVREVAPDLATSGQPDVDELAAIAATGYQCIINLALHDAEYALPDEAGTVRVLGMDYVHIPVAFDAPTPQDLRTFFAAMDANRGKRIWVHCAANKRVSAFLGLWLHLCRGVPLSEAFAPQREIWQPDAVWSHFIAATLDGRNGWSPPRTMASAYHVEAIPAERSAMTTPELSFYTNPKSRGR